MKKILLVLLMILPMTVLATDRWHTANVKYVYPLSDGSFVVTFTESSPFCTAAATVKYHYVKVGENKVTQEGLMMMYAAAMNAGTHGKTLTINFSDDTESCFINRVAVNY